MKCVILQPSFIPWRGYFHQVWKSDVFVFYDDVQYDKRGWRNRNKIKVPGGTHWLTIPVESKGVQSNATPINKVAIAADNRWRDKHLQTLRQFYRRAPYWERYEQMLVDLYSDRSDVLADFTIRATQQLAREMGITRTQFVRSSSYEVEGSKTTRLVNLLRAIGANHYISGPSARAYLDEAQFRAADISLEYMEYNYPEYDQLYPPFDPHVSVLDLLLVPLRNVCNLTGAERVPTPLSTVSYRL